eukprot:3653405-Rhodomonas_salina.1
MEEDHALQHSAERGPGVLPAADPTEALTPRQLRETMRRVEMDLRNEREARLDAEERCSQLMLSMPWP